MDLIEVGSHSIDLFLKVINHFLIILLVMLLFFKHDEKFL